MLKTLIILISIPSIFLFASNVPSSTQPPGGLSVNNVPQFVVIGFDDNSKSSDEANGGGDHAMVWILDFLKNRKNQTQNSPNPNTFDGTPARVSFYSNTLGFQNWDQEDPALLRAIHKRAYDEGHEIGNHTHGHGSTDAAAGTPEVVLAWDLDTWFNDVIKCTDLISSAGINRSDIIGFRNPFLAYSANTFTVIDSLNFKYDCSIEDGWQSDKNGSNFTWPYTLDNGSTGSDYSDSWGGHGHIDPVPGMWELPNTPIIVPPDSLCSNYGIQPGLRTLIHDRVYEHTKLDLGGPVDWDTISAKITGFDYNAWIKFQLTGKEMEVILKHTLDLRLEGNRAPLMFGAHSQYYCPSYYTSNAWTLNTNLDDMKSSIENFIDYALSKTEVRMIPASDIINWCENPKGFDNQGVSVLTNSHNKVFNRLKIISNSNIVNIQIPSGKLLSAKLYNLNGQAFKVNFRGNNTLTTPNNLAKGVYTMRLQYHNRNKWFSTKLIIK